jgi:hypothetical protein
MVFMDGRENYRLNLLYFCYGPYQFYYHIFYLRNWSLCSLRKINIARLIKVPIIEESDMKISKVTKKSLYKLYQ